MACAAVSGATALLMQRYQQRFGPGAHCTPHFLRALLAQTATDLGRPGPDYLHGFGMLDLTAALDLFDIDNGNSIRLINSDVSATAPERFFSLSSDGITPIKATLCWTDAPGDVLAAKALVNDLDLRLIRSSDQSVFYPFKLNAAAPEQAATAGVNSVDTIEQLIVTLPGSGTYLLAVRGTTLASAAAFTLASSHNLTQDIPPVARINSTTTSGAPPLLVTFDGTGSTDYDGSIVRYAWDFGDGTTSDSPSVQHVYSEGSYQARLTVFDDLGASASTSVSIGVANKPPTVVISASPESGPPPLTVFFSSDGSLDPDGSIVDYQWDFGNGATASGPSAWTTYTVGGLYFVTLTVTDNGGAQVTSTGVVLAGQSLIPASGSFSLKFNKVAADRFAIYSKTLPLDLTLDPTGLAGKVQVGTGAYNFTLDSKGLYRSSPLKIKYVPAKGQLRVTLSRAALDGALAGTGATNRDTTKESIRVPFAFCLNNGSIYGSAGLNFSYTAKRAKSGTGKLVLP
jgi:PKD repeat protein